MDEERAKDQASEADGEDLAGSLESLLEEEGLDLGGDDDALSEDDLDALFDGDEEDSKPTVSDRRDTGTSRTARADRKKKDVADYRDLEAQMKLDPLGIQISDDKMTAWISRITADNSLEEIVGLLGRHKIKAGIDYESIRNALTRASRGQIQYGVAVARGTAPSTIKPAEIIYHIARDSDKESKRSKLTSFEKLKHALDGSHVDAAKSWTGAARLVPKGELIAEIVPAEVASGTNVFGEQIFPKNDQQLTIEPGDNVSLCEDGTQCVADFLGYAGLVEDKPTVLAPMWISDDHMEARFVYTTPQPGEVRPIPTMEDLLELLEMAWIEYGIMDKQIDLIAKRLAKKLPLPVTTPIAQGTPEISGESAQVKYAFDPYSVMSWNQLQSVLGLKDAEEIENAFHTYFEEEGGHTFVAFRTDDLVVEKIPCTEGIPGTDIQGEEIAADDGHDTPLEVGDFLTISEDHLRVVSECFGLVCLKWDIQVSLLPPILISQDKNKVFYLNLPQGNMPKHPSMEEMQDLMERHEVKFGYSDERWVEILARLEAGEQTDYLICIAEGIPSERGKDAEFEWALQIEDSKPGSIMDDGSIDFRERGLNTVVKEGDMLGRLVPPKPGVPGKDVHGNDLRPPPPLNIEVITDSRIYAEATEEEGIMAFFVEAGGGISTSSEVKKEKGKRAKRINIGVYPISNIEGDVDYHTGNIDFNGDVVIKGSVQPQFSVKATGTVSIGGYVESGAYISAGGDILVKRGVVGANTELVAGGDVMTKYIQEATVRAGANVKTGSYIFNASVRAGGKVEVVGKGEGKSRALVGGLIWGGAEIMAKSIGSPYNTSTKLVAGINPDFVNRAEQIRSNMQVCEGKKQKIMKTIGVESLEVEFIKQRLTLARSPKDKQSILLNVKRIAKVAELEQNLQKELEDIAEEQRKVALKASIRVASELFTGVELRIGEQTMVINEDKDKVGFKLVQEEEELKIQEGPLR